MAHTFEIYPKLTFDQDTWRGSLKIVRKDTREIARFDQTLAALQPIPIEVRLLKLVVVTEGPETVTLVRIAQAIRDDLISTGRSALVEWLRYVETRFATVTAPEPTVADYYATLPLSATAQIRDWLREAVVDNHSWPILFWHQHEYDGTVSEPGTNL